GGLTVQYDLMLRPIRTKLRELRKEEQKILAFENTRREKTARAAQFETAKALNEDDPQYQKAKADLEIITDAEAATRTWIKLRQERERLKATAGQNKDSLKRVEQINRFLNHMVDGQHYKKLVSGELKKEYADNIAKEQKKGGKAADRRIKQFEQLLSEMEEEKPVLEPAYKTGQRIYALREKLTAVLQKQYDGLEQTNKANPNATTEQLLKDLEIEIAAIKPESMNEERIEKVQEAIQGESISEAALKQELKVLRDAVTAWTVYEMVQEKLNANQPVNFDELTLDSEGLVTAVQELQTDLSGQVSAAESKEAEYQETLVEVLHHMAKTRHKLAQVQSSTVEKEKALRRAVQDTASVVQRIPRTGSNMDWWKSHTDSWSKFNATYKDIRKDLQPLLKDEELASFNPDAEIPVPEPIAADLTWLERPSNAVVVEGPDDDEKKKKDQT
ncbi:MAG: hypothetical protein KDA84_09125, partial [Planctomycetaceae bacterium]|nr:hypothetical protein [Planctomycetaceae bacterium]